MPGVLSDLSLCSGRNRKTIMRNMSQETKRIIISCDDDVFKGSLDFLQFYDQSTYPSSSAVSI